MKYIIFPKFLLKDKFEISNLKVKLIIFFVLFLSSVSFSQLQTDDFPLALNIQPFTANYLEPKAGFLIATNENKLRLDISTSRDIIHWYQSDSSIISVGADLFTYTRLRSTDDFKFPVETIDYLFGINTGYKLYLKDNQELGLRFRLSHISTHLVDGQFDAQLQKWREGREPIVYSKEFIELFPYYKFDYFRAYTGFTYNFHVIPKVIKKINFNLGFEFYFNNIINQFVTPFVAYDFRLNGYDSYHGNNTIQVGINLNKSVIPFTAGGINIYYSYYSGKSIHGQYYDISEKYSGVGFNFEL